MANVTITAAADTSMHNGTWRTGTHWINTLTGYSFYLNNTAQLCYKKTSDGGSTWGGEQVLCSGDVIKNFSTFPEWNTPGSTGTRILISYISQTSNEVGFAYVDTSDDSTGTVQVVAVQGTGTVRATRSLLHFLCDITMAVSGKIYIRFHYQDTAITDFYGFYMSDDDGATWNSKTDPAWAAVDAFILLPGNMADQDDIYAIWMDFNTQYRFCIYDASGNSWSNTLFCTVTLATIATENKMFGANIRHSDGHIIFVCIDNLNDNTADVLCYDCTQGSIVQLTNPKDGDGIWPKDHPDVIIDNSTNNLYVMYMWGNYQVAASAYGQRSIDNGSSWASLGSTGHVDDDWRVMGLGSYNPNNGGILEVCMFNDDLDDWITNDSEVATFAPGVFNGFPMQSMAVKSLLVGGGVLGKGA